MDNIIILILQILMILVFAAFFVMLYFLWRVINRSLKKIETGLKELETGMEKFETRMEQLTVGIFLLLVEQNRFSLSEIEKIGKDLGLGEEIMSIALKRQKLLSTDKPPELKMGDTKQSES